MLYLKLSAALGFAVIILPHSTTEFISKNLCKHKWLLQMVFLREKQNKTKEG